eukprot:64752_1
MWLLDDYDERLNQVNYFDDFGSNVSNTRLLNVGDAMKSVADDDIKQQNDNGSFNEFMKNVKNGGGSTLHRKNLPKLNTDDVSGNWCKSYRDAVNNRIFFYVLCLEVMG